MAIFITVNPMTIKKSSKNLNPISILSFLAFFSSDVVSTGDLFIGCLTIKQHTTSNIDIKNNLEPNKKLSTHWPGTTEDGEHGKKQKSK